MSTFFERCVNGKEPLPCDQDFADAGVELKKSYSSIPWTGIELGAARGTTSRMITTIFPGIHADQNGLDRGDVLGALNNVAVNKNKLR